MAPLPAAQAICAPSSAASVRPLRSLPLSHRPSAPLPLSCSLHSPHAQDSLHAHNAASPSRTPHAPSLSLSPSPSLQGRCLSDHMPCIVPGLLSPILSLSQPSMSSCHGQRDLSSPHSRAALLSQITP